MKEIIIYTDGGARNNGSENNIGAFAYYLNYNGYEKSFSKGYRNVTNNQMELLAVIESLKILNQKCSVKIHSDSAYIVNAIKNRWIDGWYKNNWRRRSGTKYEELKNADLWKELYTLINFHEVEFIKVKGHSDCEFNNYVDELLNKEMDKMEE